MERLLVLAPHTDDGEFGAGGSIAKWVAAGYETHYVAFSGCEESVPAGYPRDVLRGEVVEAVGELGIAPDCVRTLDFQVRHFPRDRQDILQAMIDIRRELQPTRVLAPSLGDIHQDHAVIAEEARRAFKHTQLLGYELPWNLLEFRPVFLSRLTEEHVTMKLAAISRYRSQKARTYADPEFVRGHLRVRGVTAGGGLAEAFEVVRWMDS